MEAFSKVLEPASSAQAAIGKHSDSDSRLISHWWLEMSRGGSIYTRRITRHHKSRFFYSESWFPRLPLDVHFILCRNGLFLFSASLFWVVLMFAMVNNIVVTILILKSQQTPLIASLG